MIPRAISSQLQSASRVIADARRLIFEIEQVMSSFSTHIDKLEVFRITESPFCFGIICRCVDKGRSSLGSHEDVYKSKL